MNSTENLLADYQKKALATALPTALSLDYLVPGLIAEVGEVAGVLAKSRRDEWEEERTHNTLMGELGDVAWMLVIMAHVSDARLPEGVEAERSWCGPISLITSRAAEAVYLNPMDSVRHVWTAWLALVEDFDFTVKEVLDANVAKLADRQARGTISGSGDHR